MLNLFTIFKNFGVNIVAFHKFPVFDLFLKNENNLLLILWYRKIYYGLYQLQEA